MLKLRSFHTQIGREMDPRPRLKLPAIGHHLLADAAVRQLEGVADSMHVHVTSDSSLLGVRGVVAALRSASDPSTFSATRRDARPVARAQRRCSGAARSHNGRLERCATLVSTCTAARSATTTCARPPTQFKARALGSRCRCTERARSMASPQPAQRCSPDRSASWPVMSGGGGASARAVVN